MPSQLPTPFLTSSVASRVSGHRGAANAALAAVVAIALVVLARWLFNVAPQGMVPAGTGMKANVAIGFLLAACSLLLVSRPGPGSALLGGLTALIGALTLLQFLSGASIGLDEFAVRDHTRAFNQSPGRMAPFTAWSFVVLGAGLALARVRRAEGWVKACALQVAVFGLICVSGHLWGAVEPANQSWAPPVSLWTAAAFVLMAFALWRRVSRKAARPAQPATRAGGRPVFIASLAIGIVVISAGFAYRSIAQFATGHSTDPVKMLVSLLVTFGFALLTLIWLAVTIRAEVRRNALMARKVSRANAKLEGRVRRRTAELRRYSDRLQSMAHSLAHDLRQPLITAGCHAELLGAKLKSGSMSELLVHHEKIEVALRDIDRINDQILRFAATGDAQGAPAVRALSPSAVAP